MTDNIDACIRQARKVQNQYAFATRKAASRGGKAIRDGIRSQIPEGRGRKAGKFDGYAASGALWRSVVATEPQQRVRAGDWIVTVTVNQKANLVYARIHNVGGIIRAKQGGWLRFPKPPSGATRSAKIAGNQAFTKGGFVFAKAVRIRRKLYTSEGYKIGMRGLDEKVKREFVREVNA